MCLTLLVLNLGSPATLQSQDMQPQNNYADTAKPITQGPVDEAKVYGPPKAEAKPARPSTPIAIPIPLDQAAALAAATHPLVGATEAEAKALEAEYRGAKRGRFPSLSVEALAATSGSNLADRDGLALNAALEQPIWTGGRIRGGIARARAQLNAGEGRVDQAQRQIVNEVISAYYDYVLADERLAVLEGSLKQHNELLASIGRRVKQEVSPLADLTLGRARTAQVELDLTSTRELRETAKLRLIELTGGRRNQSDTASAKRCRNSSP